MTQPTTKPNSQYYGKQFKCPTRGKLSLTPSGLTSCRRNFVPLWENECNTSWTG